MFPYYRNNDKTDHERYLENEIERLEEEHRRDWDRQEKQREQRHQELEEQWESNARTADSWPEAFQKQSALCWREHNTFPEPDDYFEEAARANEKALEIWNTIVNNRKEELDKLQKQLDAYWDSVRSEVADELEKCSDRSEYKTTARVIRDNSLSEYLNW
jgi:hypothetical protein